KEWQGMFGGYFLPRWEEFFKRLNRSVDDGTAFDRAPVAADLCRWEQGWSRRHDSYPTEPLGDELAVTRRLIAKYRKAGLLPGS
ncbi:MAG TPA: alpha-N-acetylglucosaminidase C-terminal domain-containing protein, partial [Gemmatimonadales bacterium]|nr:alpha-N-acetylglucosaminidase C-terminal domain-containing protein [Gemmatimonadales bacterium]